jgi:sugar phosphate isomerase/epimerase
MKRRSFFGALGALGTACVVKPALAIDPFERAVPGRLRLSLAAYSLRKYLAPAANETRRMDLFDFVTYCREQGLAGAELTSYYFPDDVDDNYLLKLKRHCHLLGVSVSGGAIRNDFCTTDAAKLAADLEHTRVWIERYHLLGAPAIRIFAGNGNNTEDLSETLARCARNCQQACADAAPRGIFLALENHGGVTAKSSGLLEIVRQVESPVFGVNFDSGNFQSTDDPYLELAEIAPYAVNAQIKVEIKQAGASVPTDLKRVIGILKDAGYSGWVALEYESAEEPLEAIPRWLDQLRPLIDE